MKLREVTAHTDEDGERIVRVSGRVSTHDDPEQQTEWITFQIAFDEPTVLNGAILRAKVLEKVRDILDPLAEDFSRLGDKYRSQS